MRWCWRCRTVCWLPGCGREGYCSIRRARGSWVRGRVRDGALGRGWGGGFGLLGKRLARGIEGEGRRGVPSSIPRPERRIGTNEMVSGEIEVVVYSYPRCVFFYRRH